MRIVKNLIEKNDKTKLVSFIFDQCLDELNYNFFDRIELHIQKENKTWLDLPNAYVCLNYNNPFIWSEDVKAVKIIMLKQLISLAIAYRYMDLQIPDFIMDIMTNRETMQKGYEKDLFYYYYLMLMEHEPHEIQEFDTFMRINTPWLSYYGFDNYDSEFLKDMVGLFRYNKEFESVTNDLFIALKKDLRIEKNLSVAIATFNLISR